MYISQKIYEKRAELYPILQSIVIQRQEEIRQKTGEPLDLVRAIEIIKETTSDFADDQVPVARKADDFIAKILEREKISIKEEEKNQVGSSDNAVSSRKRKIAIQKQKIKALSIRVRLKAAANK